MNLKRHSVLASLFLILSQSAQAERVLALKISSDYFPNDLYEVGFDLDSHRLIERVSFNKTAEVPVFFEMNELKNNYVTVFKKMGFNFVKMRIVRMDSESSGTIELSILKYAVLGKRQSLYYDVRFNQATQQYDITDQRNGHPLSELVVKTNFKAGMPVGIRDITEKKD